MTTIYSAGKPEDQLGIYLIDSFIFQAEKKRPLYITPSLFVPIREQSDPDRYYLFMSLHRELHIAMTELSFSQAIAKNLPLTINSMFRNIEEESINESMVGRLFASLIPILLHCLHYYMTLVVFINVIKAFKEVFGLWRGDKLIEKYNEDLLTLQEGFRLYNKVLELESFQDIQFMKRLLPIEVKKPLYSKDYKKLVKLMSNPENYRKYTSEIHVPIYKSVNITHGFLKPLETEGEE